MDKKRGLQKTAENLEFLRRILVNGIWIAVIIVILSTVGWYIIQHHSRDSSPEHSLAAQKINKVVPPVNWSEVDRELAIILREARDKSRGHGDKELNDWISQLMVRVDGPFLDWYFSYWTQQLLGFKNIYQYGVHTVLEEQPTASEKLTEEIQQEFSQRVLQPLVAQKILERIAGQCAQIYVENIAAKIDEIPEKFSISPQEWDQYLSEIAITAKNFDNTRQLPLTLKAIGVTGVGGTVLLSSKMTALLPKAGSKILTQSSGKAASIMAVKTGGKVVAKVGGKFFGTIVGIGVLAWDIWDHNQMKQQNRPFLRSSIENYLMEMKLQLLDDPQYGITSLFISFEQAMVRKQQQSASDNRKS